MRVVVLPKSGYAAQFAAALQEASVPAAVFGQWGMPLAQMKQRLIDTKPDILHLHWPEALYGPLGDTETTLRDLGATFEAFRQHRIKVVWSLHHLYPTSRHNPELEDAVTQLFAEFADAVVHYSKWSMIRALETYRFGGEHYVVPYGYPPARSIPTKLRTRLRTELGLEEESLALVMVGPFGPGCGAVEVMRAVQASGRRDLHLFFVGRTALPDYMDELTALAGNDPRFHFTEARRAEDAARFVKAADALVDYPRPGELAPPAVSLTLGHGLPVIGPSMGHYSEILGTAAVYYEADTPEERLTERLRTVASADLDTARRRLETARQDKGHRQMVADTVLVYEDLLAEPPVH